MQIHATHKKNSHHAPSHQVEGLLAGEEADSVAVAAEVAL